MQTFSDGVPGNAVKKWMTGEVLDARSTESLLRCCYQMQHEVLGNGRYLRHIVRKSQVILVPCINTHRYTNSHVSTGPFYKHGAKANLVHEL